MNLTDLRTALALLTTLAENDAEKVIDVTGQRFGDNQGYEFLGFEKRRKPNEKMTDEEIAAQLLDRLREALAQRISDKAVTLWWNVKPELTMTPEGAKIGCRVKITAALSVVKPPKLVGIGKPH